MVSSTVRPPTAAPTPVPVPDNGSRFVNISTTPRPMAPTPNRTAEAVATRLAAALRAAERARACTAARLRLSGIPEVLLVTRRQPWAGPGRGGIQHLTG